MPDIRFDEARHEYSVDGSPKMSVTQIIGASGLINQEWYSVDAMTRGTAVHRACHYLDENDLDRRWIETSPYAGYVRSWIGFKEETGFLPELVEARVYNAALDYCGTLDRTGIVHGSQALIDLKTGGPEPWHALQTVAYAGTFDKPRSFRRMTVHLKRDGSRPHLHEHPVKDFTEHWNVFQACILISNFRGGMKHVRSTRNAGSGAA